jgi:hypothetical protein
VAPASPPATTSSAAASPSSVRSPPATVSDVLASDRVKLDACYARARAENPSLGRTSVDMTFTIDAQGEPKTVDLQYKHRMDERAKECLRDAALSLHFPPALQGQQTGKILFSPPAQ